MIVIRDVGCDAGIYLSETEPWWTVSVRSSVFGGCVGGVTSPASRSAQRRWDPGWVEVWDLGHKLFLLSAHFLSRRTAFIISITWQLACNCLWVRIKVRRSRLGLAALRRHVTALISHELLYVIPTSVFVVSTLLFLKRHDFVALCHPFCVLWVVPTQHKLLDLILMPWMIAWLCFLSLSVMYLVVPFPMCGKKS